MKQAIGHLIALVRLYLLGLTFEQKIEGEIDLVIKYEQPTERRNLHLAQNGPLRLDNLGRPRAASFAPRAASTTSSTCSASCLISGIDLEDWLYPSWFPWLNWTAWSPTIFKNKQQSIFSLLVSCLWVSPQPLKEIERIGLKPSKFKTGPKKFNLPESAGIRWNLIVINYSPASVGRCGS